MPDAFLDHDVEDNRLRHWIARMASPAAEQIVIKAADDSGLCGFACAFVDADAQWGALLDNLHVAPALTGHGIGARLLDETRRRVALLRPASGLHLWVFEANTNAQRFYERHGGVKNAQQIIEVLPGLHVPEVRYVWAPADDSGSRTGLADTPRER